VVPVRVRAGRLTGAPLFADPELSVDMPVLGIHELTERKLGMFKR
jgi:hypothetical protein